MEKDNMEETEKIDNNQNEKKTEKSKKIEEKENEISEDSIEEKVVEEKPKKKRKNKKGKFLWKKVIIISSIILFLIIAFIIFKVFISPGLNYNSAKNSFEKKDYKTTIDKCESLGDYKDCKELLNQSYFEYGKILIEKEKFKDAVEMLSKTTIEKSKDYLTYATALKNIDDKKLDEAIKSLMELKEFEKAEYYTKKAYYLKAQDVFEKGEDYSSAKSLYEKAGDYEDTTDEINLCNLMIAEKKYADGYLSESLELFSKLPKELEYKGIKVTDRINTLNNYKEFVKLSGKWKGTKGYMEVKHIWKRDNSWESWYNSYTAYTSIQCVINEDGSVKVSGTANFYSYTNYSTLNYALKQKEVSVPFSVTVKKGGSIPETLVSNYPALVAGSGATGSVDVKYSKNKISLNFVLNDKEYSQNFSNYYTSKITYSKQ